MYIGDLDGVLHAVRLQDGARLWTFETESEIKSSPILVNDLVLIGSYDTFLYALESETGKLRWKVQTDAQVHATPAVQNGLVFLAGCDGAFRAIQVVDGREAYRIESGAYTGASPVVAGDRAYFGTFGYEVMALDLNEREILWRYRNPDREFPYYSSATLSDGLVILGGRDKLVHAIDTETGDAVWTFQTLARVDSSPVVAGDRVYVGFERRPPVRLRCCDWRKTLGVRRGGGAHSFAVDCRWPCRHRIDRRRPLFVLASLDLLPSVRFGYLSRTTPFSWFDR